jgi:HK97 gp10 family phage protein
MVTINIQIQPSLETKLNADWNTIEKEACQKISQECLKIMKTEVPVDTGQLRDSLTINQDGEDDEITSSTSYWMYVNYGTSKQAPNPYIERSLSNLENQINNIIIGILKSKGI